MNDDLLPLELITQGISILRGQKVLLDADLAQLYGVPTKRFNEQVKRNLARFPSDFMFQVTEEEFATLRSHFATSNGQPASRGGRRYFPFAFTEHGAIMAATILNNTRATQVSVYVVRAFVRLRELIVSNKELALRLDDLENKTELMSLKHDTFEHNTGQQLKQLLAAIRELMAPAEPARKRPIGFVTPDDSPAKPKAAKGRD
jgi:hypothetical protein